MLKSKTMKSKKGQATVELALLLPVLLLILIGIFEFGRVFSAYLIVSHASREGARSAVVGNDDLTVLTTITNSMFYLDSTNLTVNISPDKSYRVRGSTVTVNLKYNIDIIVPMIENIVPDPLPLEVQTTMRVE